MREPLHELSEIRLTDAVLTGVVTRDDLTVTELSIEVYRQNLARFRGDAEALLGEAGEATITVVCERCLWVQIGKTFLTTEAAERYAAEGPAAVTNDIIDGGLVAAERSAPLRAFAGRLPGLALIHVHLSTALNEIDVVCERVGVQAG